MSDIDLTDAIEAGRRGIGIFAVLVSSPQPVLSGERTYLTSPDADVLARAIVVSAAPLIEAQVREQIAREIDHLQAGVESNDARVALRAAARIARDEEATA